MLGKDGDVEAFEEVGVAPPTLSVPFWDGAMSQSDVTWLPELRERIEGPAGGRVRSARQRSGLCRSLAWVEAREDFYATEEARRIQTPEWDKHFNIILADAENAHGSDMRIGAQHEQGVRFIELQEVLQCLSRSVVLSVGAPLDVETDCIVDGGIIDKRSAHQGARVVLRE